MSLGENTTFVLDVSWYAHRAFYTNPEHAAGVFAGMVGKLRSNHRPERILACLDSYVGSWRRDIFPAYKADRAAHPPELDAQIATMCAQLKTDGVPCLQFDGAEADDVIASVANSLFGPVVIVGTDKDLMQLVDNRVRLLDTMRDIVIDAAWVEERWGVPPNKLRDLLALIGDKGDGIPGVPGVGKQTAGKLLGRFGSIDEMYRRITHLANPKLQKVLTEHEQDVRLWQRLVSLRATLIEQRSDADERTEGPFSPEPLWA